MRIYVSIVGDLFHYGHIEYLRRIKDYGEGNNFLVIGLHNDEVVKSYKRTPIQTMEERKKIIEACKYVDEIYLDAPLYTTRELVNKLNCDLVASTICNCGNYDHDHQYDDVEDILIKFSYTEGISTTDLIRRCYERYIEDCT